MPAWLELAVWSGFLSRVPLAYDWLFAARLPQPSQSVFRQVSLDTENYSIFSSLECQ